MTKHIICYSGGHSSALVAIEIVGKYGKENCIFVIIFSFILLCLS